VVLVSRPVGADSISDAKAKAAQIESELANAQSQMSALSQQYDAARVKLDQVDSDIATTKAAIAVNQAQVSKDKTILEKAAIANYVSDGAAASENPIFSNNEKTIGAATEYNQIASGDLNQAVANLHTAENKLAAQEAQLATQQGQAQSAVSTEQAAVAQNQQVVQEQSGALAQENGQIATLVQQQAAAEAAQAAQASAAKLAAVQTASSTASSGGGGPAVDSAAANPPPVAAGGAGAVAAAESQLGVPYVWGGETPGVGFDCSGLTAWSWGQAGVPLPHYSGAQMADSTPVPLSDLQPGDLLFYGPGGSDHVAMYVSPGTMIEAPETGSFVHLTGLRLDSGFVGAGRP
jgi:cell wall-associated NlpC family hydrolase